MGVLSATLGSQLSTFVVENSLKGRCGIETLGMLRLREVARFAIHLTPLSMTGTQASIMKAYLHASLQADLQRPLLPAHRRSRLPRREIPAHPRPPGGEWCRRRDRLSRT